MMISIRLNGCARYCAPPCAGSKIARTNSFLQLKDRHEHEPIPPRHFSIGRGAGAAVARGTVARASRRLGPNHVQGLSWSRWEARLRPGRTGQRDPRCVIRGIWRWRRGDPDCGGEGEHLARRRRQHRARTGGDRQGLGPSARRERLPRRAVAQGRLLQDGAADHHSGERRRFARRRHGRHGHHPHRHRHGTARRHATAPRAGGPAVLARAAADRRGRPWCR